METDVEVDLQRWKGRELETEVERWRNGNGDGEAQKWRWEMEKRSGVGVMEVEEEMEIRKDERSGGGVRCGDVEAEVEKWKSGEVVQYGKRDKRKVGKKHGKQRKNRNVERKNK